MEEVMLVGKDLLEKTEKPKNWPVNAKERELENIFNALDNFIKDPNYKNKELLVALIDGYDLNQKSMLGMHRITDYEVCMITVLYFNASIINCNILKTYLYGYVGRVGRLQKIAVYMNVGVEKDLFIKEFRELCPSLYIYYCSYLCFVVDKDKGFADKVIEVMNNFVSTCENDEELFEIVHGLVTMINDLSYFECKKREEIWAFSRDEIKKIMSLEASLTSKIGETAIERPLKGVLMTTISNYVLKSRYDYNSDYIVKYISEDVAKESNKNHEIWIRSIEFLNDPREEKAFSELFDDCAWLHKQWVDKPDLTKKRKYFVSSFCKNVNDAAMKLKYGKCVYGFKNDRLVELLSPIHFRKNKIGQEFPYFSQVTVFDVLYDKEEAKCELNYLCELIDCFDLSETDKNIFLEQILQYWILSVKDKEWENERERRYVMFLYEDYKYNETDMTDEEFLKVKTTMLLAPDFALGDNPVKFQIEESLMSKREYTDVKEYYLCPNCLSADFDAFLEPEKRCKVCGNDNVIKVEKR